MKDIECGEEDSVLKSEMCSLHASCWHVPTHHVNEAFYSRTQTWNTGKGLRARPREHLHGRRLADDALRQVDGLELRGEALHHCGVGLAREDEDRGRAPSAFATEDGISLAPELRLWSAL